MIVNCTNETAWKFYQTHKNVTPETKYFNFYITITCLILGKLGAQLSIFSRQTVELWTVRPWSNLEFELIVCFMMYEFELFTFLVRLLGLWAQLSTFLGLIVGPQTNGPWSPTVRSLNVRGPVYLDPTRLTKLKVSILSRKENIWKVVGCFGFFLTLDRGKINLTKEGEEVNLMGGKPKVGLGTFQCQHFLKKRNNTSVPVFSQKSNKISVWFCHCLCCRCPHCSCLCCCCFHCCCPCCTSLYCRYLYNKQRQHTCWSTPASQTCNQHF